MLLAMLRQSAISSRYVGRRMASSLSQGSSNDMKYEFDEKSGLLTAYLNRPKALNALNLSMAKCFYGKLKQCKADERVKAVVVRGEGDRSFCSGGDILAVTGWDDSEEDYRTVGDEFFRAEYTLDHMTHAFPKPYVALQHGVVMGGGVGLSVHTPFRIAFADTLFAMPETAIGLFPDVGGGFFLPRMPHEGLGLFLALTGHRLKAVDCLHAGVSTHYSADKSPEQCVQLLKDAGADVVGNHEAMKELLDKNFVKTSDVKPEDFSLSPQLPEIAEHFRLKEDVGDILASLARETDSDFGKTQLKILRKMSPTSVVLAFEQMKLCRDMETLADVLKLEYRLSQRCVAGQDFREGVRALLVDKDKKPRWQPNSIGQVDREEIFRYFTPLIETTELEIPQEDLPIPSSK